MVPLMQHVDAPQHASKCMGKLYSNSVSGSGSGILRVFPNLCLCLWNQNLLMFLITRLLPRSLCRSLFSFLSCLKLWSPVMFWGVPPFQEHHCNGTRAASERSSLERGCLIQRSIFPTQLSKAQLPWTVCCGCLCWHCNPGMLQCSWTSWAHTARSASCHMKMTSWSDVQLKPPNCALLLEQRWWVGLGFTGKRLGWSGIWIKAAFDSSAQE